MDRGVRACDACHAQKVRCKKNQASSEPCEQCIGLNIPCTYNRPQRRHNKRRTESHLSNTNAQTTNLDKGNSNGSTWRSPSSATFPASASPNAPLNPIVGIASICDREIFDAIVDDYISRIYTLSPFIHKPTFAADLARDRASEDPVFCAFCFSLVALTLAMLPVRFSHYQQYGDRFPYKNIMEFLERCDGTVMAARGRAYFEKPNVQKLAISFMMAYTCHNVSMNGRAFVFAAECSALLRSMALQHAKHYSNISPVRAQLEKKMFWMIFMWQVHDRLDNFSNSAYQWLPIPDTMYFDSRELDLLLPIGVDDEYISDSGICSPPQDEVQLCSGFIGVIEVFLCFVALPSTRARYLSAGQSDVDVLRDMFDRICRVPDKLPSTLRIVPNHADSGPYATPNTRAVALEANRANIHVTQLWARYLIFDRLVSAHRQSLASENPTSSEIHTLASFVQSEHETICDRLLQFLRSVEIRSLESNGISISYKIRQVASLLLDYQAASIGESKRREGTTFQGVYGSSYDNADVYKQNRGLGERAQNYINEFLELLTRLEHASSQEMQRLICREAWQRMQHSPQSV